VWAVEDAIRRCIRRSGRGTLATVWVVEAAVGRSWSKSPGSVGSKQHDSSPGEAWIEAHLQYRLYRSLDDFGRALGLDFVQSEYLRSEHLEDMALEERFPDGFGIATHQPQRGGERGIPKELLHGLARWRLIRSIGDGWSSLDPEPSDDSAGTARSQRTSTTHDKSATLASFRSAVASGASSAMARAT